MSRDSTCFSASYRCTCPAHRAFFFDFSTNTLSLFVSVFCTAALIPGTRVFVAAVVAAFRFLRRGDGRLLLYADLTMCVQAHLPGCCRC